MIVFGGTFDPIHFGHLAAARHVSKLLGDATVVLMPAPMPQLRQPPEASFEHRWQMSLLASKLDDHLVASRFEDTSEGPTRTIETLQALATKSKCTTVWVLGSDAFRNIANWYDAEKLPEVASLFVLTRPQVEQLGSSTTFEQVTNAHRLLDGPGSFYVSRTKMPDISATVIRHRLRNGLDVSEMIPQEIREHIMQNGLYQS
ncbi:MAG: nicotinate (nicotinamide) nucleotide adenylyltransferase [Gammaproteobacteria bacterium]|nr:nicotinate (nicotinamide) nucleotide adenylyltransferase [Gammaproteobacteria bacterium]